MQGSFSHKLRMANTNIQFMVYPLQISPWNIVKNRGWNFRNLYAVRFMQCRARFRISRSCWVGVCNHSWSPLSDKPLSISPSKNPPAAKCFSEKSTKCKVAFLKIHQLLSIHTAVGGFSDQALRSWWTFISRGRYDLVKSKGWSFRNLYVVRLMQCRARFRLSRLCWVRKCNHSRSIPCR